MGDYCRSKSRRSKLNYAKERIKRLKTDETEENIQILFEEVEDDIAQQILNFILLREEFKTFREREDIMNKGE